MRISISNIAWNPAEDEHVADILAERNIDAIDVAPTKYFPSLKAVSVNDLNVVRCWWEDRGIEIIGMQSLMFGMGNLNLFGVPDIQAEMLEYLKSVCDVGAGLGAKYLVFGSPKNRDRLSYTDSQARTIAVDFFRRLGDFADSLNMIICLEPNPAIYGCNYLRNSMETAAVVRSVAHPAIRMQLDTGALQINKEDVGYTLLEYADIIGHVHLSEPNLICIQDSDFHYVAGKLISEKLPEHIATIEMLNSNDANGLANIEQALDIVIHNYRSNQQRALM
ncbi:sugar phosphate isomerase/epimerase family protein [Leeia oryzae]|uniref:sugar phosphate isomerase/epimerase family protein n=1 Tax=Leeia oryzae TaxID=356662 RepID=UPI00036D8EAE|nr:sugar phosphate isomerase/epimerase [Leeia oryzae]